MKKRIGDLIDRVTGVSEIVFRMDQIRQRINDDNLHDHLLVGRVLANLVRTRGIYENIHDAEFQAFSQFGDDGILQYLINQTQPPVEKFIEFGVENYTEANTRFLLLNNNWSGLIIDGDPANIEFVKRQPEYWRYDLQAVAQFVDRDNINALFETAGYTGEIGLLSIDIDGNDYWVWEAINSINPVIVTVEYNSVFGMQYAITIPYNPAFNRTKMHYSNLYWGASLKALCALADRKGYAFVGCNSNGNNAHFVRKDKAGKIPIKSVEQGYVESKFRESRDKDGNLTFLRGNERLEAIKDMQIFDIEKGQLVFIKDLLNLNRI